MKRLIDYFLMDWKNSSRRKPLLLRGARQVGKTYAIRELGKKFKNFIEINLETDEAARKILEKDLDVKRVIFQLSELLKKEIVLGKTLLFLDEIQIAPKVIILLRYFYELIPELHVVAAGSLLDFAIEQVGVPVGRITTLYMYPMSFMEFLVALDHKIWANAILKNREFSESLHEKLLEQLGIYLAIGGLPEVVKVWQETSKPRQVKNVHANQLYAYEQDFGKYATKYQLKYLNILFLKSIEQLSKKFIYSRIGEYQKRELEPALELLEKAGLFYKIFRSAGQGIPIGAQADLNYFKIIFLDVGLTQALLKFDITSWFIDPMQSFVNKGEIVEAFIGQELLAYSDPIRKETLYFWDKETRSSEAEVDYLIQLKAEVVPIEVKSGLNRRIKSMHIFLDSHPNSKYGIRFWSGPAEKDDRIYSYPLYSIAKPLIADNEHLFNALFYLVN